MNASLPSSKSKKRHKRSKLWGYLGISGSALAAFAIASSITTQKELSHPTFLFILLTGAYLLQAVLFFLPLAKLTWAVWKNEAEQFEKNQLYVPLIVALPLFVQSFIAPSIWKTLWSGHVSEPAINDTSLLLGLNIWCFLLLAGHLSYQTITRNKHND
ncbi:MAG: hypothetical protein H6660_05090 [Ardenticatenaceae bacterium]|nr:hypothetical protein [Ardenticatenaceae bacterium]